LSNRNFKVIVLPRAKRDINKIWFEVAAANPTAADRLLLKFDARVLSLREYPERGAPRDELSRGLRIIVEGKYLIFYRVKGSRVEIVRVLHGAQDLLRQFN
jgi:toxin ParE1/3/4